MRQDEEQRVLHEICKNAKMGVEAINQVLKNVYDEEFAYELNIEANKMKEFERRANRRLQSYGDGPADTKPMAKTMLKSAIQMKTMFRDDTSHIADMMQKGNQRGIGELKNAIHKYKDAGIYATELAKEMIDFEEDNLRKMSVYKDD